MELSTAIKLIEQGVDKNSTKQKWADLGAGSGLFTLALSSLLHPGSVIDAIDKDPSIKKVRSASSDVEVKTSQRDFVNGSLGVELFDGIIMANSIHYVAKKNIFLEQLKENLSPIGRLIIVEYDMNKPNKWVPYPIPFVELLKLVKECGFSSLVKLHEVPSVYHKANIYSAMVKTV